jgi:hypothetical protein
VFTSLDIFGTFPGVKRPGLKVDRIPLSGVEVKKGWSRTYAALYLHCVERENFTVTFTWTHISMLKW